LIGSLIEHFHHTVEKAASSSTRLCSISFFIARRGERKRNAPRVEKESKDPGRAAGPDGVANHRRDDHRPSPIT
jgi:hypothetical protein